MSLERRKKKSAVATILGAGCPSGKPCERAFGIVAVFAETLRPKSVRHAEPRGFFELVDHTEQLACRDVTKHDREAIALQVPRFEFVWMALGRLDPDPLDFDP